MLTDFGFLVENDTEIELEKGFSHFYDCVKEMFLSFPHLSLEKTQFFFHGHPYVIAIMTGLIVDNVIPAHNATVLMTVDFEKNCFVGKTNYSRAEAKKINKTIDIISNQIDSDIFDEMSDAIRDGMVVKPYYYGHDVIRRNILDCVEISGAYMVINPSNLESLRNSFN